MTKTIFITGTDTGVGKTLVTATLARWAEQNRIKAAPFKPLQSGGVWEGERLVFSDGHVLQASIGARLSLDLIAPYRFKPELAPSVILEEQKRSVDMQDFQTAYERVSRDHDHVLMEGVGGVAIPMSNEVHTIDMIKHFDARVLVVARLGLGTINHTTLTIEYLRSHGIEPFGVIFSDAAGSAEDVSKAKNPGIVERLANIKILGVIPQLVMPESAGPELVKHLDVAGARLEMDQIFA